MNKLRIIHSNIRGIRSNKASLDLLSQQLQPDIVCLNETLLRPQTQINFHDKYEVIRKERPNGAGGIAMLVSKSLRSLPIDLPPPVGSTEAMACLITTTTARKICILCMYNSPLQQPTDTNLIDHCLQLHHSLIVVGDLNSKHGDWDNSGARNANGTALADYLETRDDLVILNSPDQPTRYSTTRNGGTVLDLVICTTNLATTIESLEIMCPIGTSDHETVMADFALRMERQSEVTKKIYHFERADWNKFREEIDRRIELHPLAPLPQNANDGVAFLDNYTQFLETTIIDAANIAIPTKRVNKRPPFSPSHELKTLIRERNRARRRLRQSHSQADRQIRNRFSRDIKRLLVQERQDSWKAFTESIDKNDMSSAWKKLKALKKGREAENKSQVLNGPLDASGNRIYIRTDQDISNAFANHLSSVFREQQSENFNVDHHRQVNQWFEAEHPSWLPRFEDGSDLDLVIPITTAEVKLAIQHTKNRAPGNDGVYAIFLKEASPALIENITSLYNHCYKTGYHPRAWKQGKICMIPKPNKNRREVTSYRPITLLSVLGKCLERVINARIKFRLEGAGSLNEAQSGGRANRSVSDHLARLGHAVANARIGKKYCLMIFADMEKAFDSVWHAGLLYKIRQQHSNTILRHEQRWIFSYLTNRECYVQVGERKSAVIHPSAGVPQGGVVSPMLYILFTNDLPVSNYRNNIFGSQFIDDIAYWSSGKDAGSLRDRVQAATDGLAEFCSKWRIKLNPDKTQLIYVKPSRIFTCYARQYLNMNLLLYNNIIAVQKNAKFLGVQFDHNATFKPHTSVILQSCRNKINLLKCLAGTNWGSSPETLIHFYKTFVRPSIEFGAVAWCGMAECHWNAIKQLETWSIRLALRMPLYTPTKWLYQLTKIQPIKERIRHLVRDYIQKAVHVHHRRLIEKMVNKARRQPTRANPEIQTNLQFIGWEP